MDLAPTVATDREPPWGTVAPARRAPAAGHPPSAANHRLDPPARPLPERLVTSSSAADRHRRSRLHDQSGFTWSELALVLVFVAGLLIVAVAAMNGIRDDTRGTNCQDAKRALMVATNSYHAANDSYPINKEVLIDSGFVDEDDVEGWIVEFEAGSDTPTYVPTGPCA